MEEQFLMISQQRLDELNEALDGNLQELDALIDNLCTEYNIGEGEQQVFNAIRRYMSIYADMFYNFLSGKSVYTSTNTNTD